MRHLGTIVFGLVIALLVGGLLFLFVGGVEQGVIETRYGTIVLEFWPRDLPNTVKNWKELARSGFYDGIRFHRTIPGMFLQGGDPLSKNDDPEDDGAGGPGYTIPYEPSEHPHVRGTVSMARFDNPNTAGSQFFICLTSVPWLDRQFAAFAHVVEGMDVVDTITARPKRDPEHPRDPVRMDRVYIRTLYRLPLIGSFSF